MSKTPEEIAADAAAEWIKNSTTSHSLANACALYGYNAGFLAGYQAAKDQLADDSKVMPQWISVKDRLPEIGEWVVVDSLDCCQRTKPPSNKFESIFVWETTFNHYLKADAIKWWMPLPYPPEEK
jgi:hypothetical protein